MLFIDLTEQTPHTCSLDAIKFTASGHVRIYCYLRAELDHDPNERVLGFDVVDTGIGVNDKDQSLLFKPFSQVDSGANRKFSGTGLGLSICRELTALMKGACGYTFKRTLLC